MKMLEAFCPTTATNLQNFFVRFLRSLNLLLLTSMRPPVFLPAMQSIPRLRVETVFAPTKQPNWERRCSSKGFSEATTPTLPKAMLDSKTSSMTCRASIATTGNHLFIWCSFPMQPCMTSSMYMLDSTWGHP